VTGGAEPDIYVQDVPQETAGRITRALDAAGVPAIEVGHGDGLAGSARPGTPRTQQFLRDVYGALGAAFETG
jgi:hypothetical protein